MFSGNVPTYYDDKGWKTVKPRFDFILQYWEIGGVEGGNWTENSNPHSYKTDENIPKEFDDLDNILTEVCPNISFLMYKKIQQMVMYFKAINYEYYGNNTEYQVRYINLKDLYDFLVKKCNLLGIGH